MCVDGVDDVDQDPTSSALCARAGRSWAPPPPHIHRRRASKSVSSGVSIYTVYTHRHREGQKCAVCCIAHMRPTAQSAAISPPSRRGLAVVAPTVLVNVIACRISSVHVGNSPSVLRVIPLDRHEVAVTGVHWR